MWSQGFPGGTVVKNLPAIQEMQVWSLGQEDTLEEGMATHSKILATTGSILACCYGWGIKYHLIMPLNCKYKNGENGK